MSKAHSWSVAEPRLKVISLALRFKALRKILRLPLSLGTPTPSHLNFPSSNSSCLYAFLRTTFMSPGLCLPHLPTSTAVTFGCLCGTQALRRSAPVSLSARCWPQNTRPEDGYFCNFINWALRQGRQCTKKRMKDGTCPVGL